MNTHKLFFAVLIGLMAYGSIPAVAQEQTPPPYVGSAAFERMKQLAGSWQGMMDMGCSPL